MYGNVGNVGARRAVPDSNRRDVLHESDRVPGLQARLRRGVTAVAVAGIAAAVVAACGSKGSSPSSPTAPSTGGTAGTGCQITASSMGGQVNDPNGPFFHRVNAADTTDGTTITNARFLLDHASVPDGVRMPDGSVGIYYVNGSENAVWFGRFNGSTLTPVSAISIDGFSRPNGVVDPDATLVNGRIRLVYLLNHLETGSRAYCIAESSDGISFQTLSTAMSFSNTYTDPSMVQLQDGTWLLAGSSGQSTILARSMDGLTFSQYGSVSYGGVPEVALTNDGRVRLYVCANGIESYVSGDSGSTWTREGTVVPPGTLGMTVCDPSYVAGANLFVFKTAG